jgi:hypothetical protein
MLKTGDRSRAMTIRGIRYLRRQMWKNGWLFDKRKKRPS